jgi:hypothetical protein
MLVRRLATSLALEVVREAEMPAPLSALAGGTLCERASDAGPGQDHARLVRWLEQCAKAQLAS